ncbi:histone acetyltransferase type B catalytic subunit [Diabrotica virgifera virgifera]|uniref:histone acetyltransferase n=1 Tax=Diabrotica virgifera virgifera TaxID=50390 RepID=A0A6P7FJT5_DIAVI|nr:histone acetyltransferase type B catalytic subunit [Diabrotica virgifera virgifera]
MAGTSSSNGHLECEDEEMSVYRKDSNAVVTFNIVFNERHLTEPCLTFKPIMSHQVFENECIFGYKSLAIKLTYLHNSAKCYVDVVSSGIIERDGHKPDDVMECLNPWLPENYTTDRDEFTQWISKEQHDVIFGHIIHEHVFKGEFFEDPSVEVQYTYKITQCDIADEDFKKFHQAFETYVIWFIDGATFIDLDDEKWEIFYVYEEVKHPKTGEMCITPVGFCTVYKFYSYPANIRSRISQFFILPTHQKRGLGTALYQAVFKTLQSLSSVTDITVEEPTPIFQKIRDRSDCRLVKESLEKNKLDISSTHIKKIFAHLKDLKFGKKQIQRIYDILCGCEASLDKFTYNQFFKNINKRIESEVNNRMKVGMKKMRLVTEGNATHALVDEEAVAKAEFQKYKEDLESAVNYVKNKL